MLHTALPLLLLLSGAQRKQHSSNAQRAHHLAEPSLPLVSREDNPYTTLGLNNHIISHLYFFVQSRQLTRTRAVRCVSQRLVPALAASYRRAHQVLRLRAHDLELSGLRQPRLLRSEERIRTAPATSNNRHNKGKRMMN